MGSVCPGELKADINQTLEAFEHILHLYRSGLHLDDLPPSESTGNRAQSHLPAPGKRLIYFFFFNPLPPFFWCCFNTTFNHRLCFHFVSQEEKERKVVFFFPLCCFDRFIRQLE